MSTQTINIPQLALILILGFLAARWFFSKPPTTTSSTSNNNNRRLPLDPQRVVQVSRIFPQEDRRRIAWDLQRNGGNVAATSERLLGGRGLEDPPPSFRPNLPSSPTTSSSSTPNKPTHPDLITRYNLSSKLSSTPSAPSSSSDASTPASTPSKGAWSSSKTERAQLLKGRREEMILAARRKLEESERRRREEGGEGKAA